MASFTEAYLDLLIENERNKYTMSKYQVGDLLLEQDEKGTPITLIEVVDQVEDGRFMFHYSDIKHPLKLFPTIGAEPQTDRGCTCSFVSPIAKALYL